MTENKDIPQFVACGLEMGNCGYQIPYDMAEHDRIIRADAIDECIKLIGGNTKTIVGIVFDNSIPIHDRALGRMAKNKLIEELVEQLEQLKEQK